MNEKELRMIVQKKMRLPTLNTPQIQWIIQQVQTHIGQQRQTYRRGAAPLDLGPKDGMRSSFPEAALDPARLVVLAGKYVNNPPFYSKLMKLGFEAASLPDFAHMAAITFADTVVSHRPFTGQAPVPRTRPRRPVPEARFVTILRPVR